MMTLEQLQIFVAVAEREHLTRAAEAIGLTPSAVSSAIKNLEGFYGVALFNRVGRRIELTQTGRLFLDEAKATLSRARAAELTLAELGGMQRGDLNVYASQTIASYWLPPFLMKFHDQYPGVEIHLSIGNTKTVSDAVRGGAADIGFIEGDIDEPTLAKREVAEDALVIVVGPKHPWADGKPIKPNALITQTTWILREAGSGTRSEFESALRDQGVDPARLRTALVLPMLHAGLGLSATQYGIFSGLTVYAVPQVLAATAPAGTLAVQVGTLVKLIRVLMLGPVIFTLALIGGRARETKLPIAQVVPWFIIGFIVMMVACSFELVPDMARAPMKTTASFLTILAMAALGLSVDIRKILHVGGRVVIAALLSLIFLCAASGAVLVVLGS